jgi:two-component system response regulator YesN
MKPMWNLLVVEDESIVRLGLRYMLDWESYGICWKAEAASGEEALRVLQKEDIHIVMTDIRMPGMDGLELSRRIRESGAGVQIIILSSYDSFSYVKEALRLGAVDYLHKPTMDERELAAVLEKAAARLTETAEPKAVMTAEARNEYLLSLLDKYTFPENALMPELEQLLHESGFWLTVFRKRDDAMSGEEDADHLRFMSIQYLIEEYVSRDWGGVVFHRSFREVIWLAPVRLDLDNAGRTKYLDKMRQKVLELLNVALIYSASSSCISLQQAPEAYMEALLRFPVNEQSDNLIVRKAKEYLDKHLLEEMTLVKVAEAIHISPGYLSRIFQKNIGESFIDYHTRNKLEYAQKLLRETNRKVYEIAADIGYANPHYFSKLFKERIGVTPLEYRNQ